MTRMVTISEAADKYRMDSGVFSRAVKTGKIAGENHPTGGVNHYWIDDDAIPAWLKARQEERDRCAADREATRKRREEKRRTSGGGPLPGGKPRRIPQVSAPTPEPINLLPDIAILIDKQLKPVMTRMDTIAAVQHQLKLMMEEVVCACESTCKVVIQIEKEWHEIQNSPV